MNYLYWKIRDSWYYLKCLVWHNYNYLKLRDDPRWNDKVEEVRQALFALLVNFVEKERPDEIVNWDSDEEHKNAWSTIVECYSYIVKIRNVLVKDIEELENELFLIIGEINNLSIEEKSILDEIQKLEEQLDKKDTKVLVDIINVRNFLWT